jgi:uncharacterized protein YqcC (DUF446 family)
MTEREKAAKRLTRRCRKIIDECDQALRDIGWWNENRTEHPPLDPEPFRVHGMLAREVLSYVEAGKPIPADIGDRFVNYK